MIIGPFYQDGWNRLRRIRGQSDAGPLRHNINILPPPGIKKFLEMIRSLHLLIRNDIYLIWGENVDIPDDSCRTLHIGQRKSAMTLMSRMTSIIKWRHRNNQITNHNWHSSRAPDYVFIQFKHRMFSNLICNMKSQAQIVLTIFSWFSSILIFYARIKLSLKEKIAWTRAEILLRRAYAIWGFGDL